MCIRDRTWTFVCYFTIFFIMLLWRQTNFWSTESVIPSVVEWELKVSIIDLDVKIIMVTKSLLFSLIVSLSTLLSPYLHCFPLVYIWSKSLLFIWKTFLNRLPSFLAFFLIFLAKLCPLIFPWAIFRWFPFVEKNKQKLKNYQWKPK